MESADNLRPSGMIGGGWVGSSSLKQPLLYLHHRQFRKDLLQDLEKESRNGHCCSRRRSH